MHPEELHSSVAPSILYHTSTRSFQLLATPAPHMMLASKSQNTECLLLWFGSLLIALANCSLQGAPCYNDDGKIIKGDVACNPDAEQSFCCGEYWTCLDSGVCSDQNTTQFIGSAETLLARATCTDRTYSSSTCPQFCLGSELVQLRVHLNERVADLLSCRPRSRYHPVRHKQLLLLPTRS